MKQGVSLWVNLNAAAGWIIGATFLIRPDWCVIQLLKYDKESEFLWKMILIDLNVLIVTIAVSLVLAWLQKQKPTNYRVPYSHSELRLTERLTLPDNLTSDFVQSPDSYPEQQQEPIAEASRQKQLAQSPSTQAS